VSRHSRPIAAVRITSSAVHLALLDTVSFFPTGPHLQEVLPRIEKNQIFSFWRNSENHGTCYKSGGCGRSRAKIKSVLIVCTSFLLHLQMECDDDDDDDNDVDNDNEDSRTKIAGKHKHSSYK